MAKKFSAPVAKMSPESRARSDALYRQLRAEMPLQALRRALDLARQQVAASLGIDRGAAVLRARGFGRERCFRKHHRVLGNARWSVLAAGRPQHRRHRAFARRQDRPAQQHEQVTPYPLGE